MGHSVGPVFLGALIVLFSSIKTTNLSTVTCSLSKNTVQAVSNCPVTQEEWRNASQRKNCSALVSNCSDPDKYVYHCVINSFLNETLEVCAIEKIIFLGYCTEYSSSANRIQQSYKANCTKFSRSPCPTDYSSTEAYKYPDCYELTKKSTTENPTTLMLSTSVSTDSMHTVTVGENLPAGSNDKKDIGLVIGIVIGIIVLVILLATVTIYLYRRHHSKEKGRHQILVTESEKVASQSYPIGQIEEEGSLEEKIHFAPSGICYEAGSKGRETIKVDEEDSPEILLNPGIENTEENECQALLNLLSDGLGRIVIRQSAHSNEHDNNLQDLAKKIYENTPQPDETSTTAIEEYIRELESLERSLEQYFQRAKINENVYMPPE